MNQEEIKSNELGRYEVTWSEKIRWDGLCEIGQNGIKWNKVGWYEVT